MKFVNNFLIPVLVSLLVSACQSTKPLASGIQPGYEAVNPAAIVAVPAFSLPDPSAKATIDPAIIISDQIFQLLQAKINTTFSNQPNINGYSFDAVSKALASTQVLSNLDKIMKNIAQRFSARDSSTRSLITSSCLGRKNFLEFYSYCLATDQSWISNLNALSAKIMNADAALFIVVTDLESPVVEGKYEIKLGFSVLLVDTNNGKLIWGKNGAGSLVNPAEKQYFPNWSDLINTIFSKNFYAGFPGRIASK